MRYTTKLKKVIYLFTFLISLQAFANPAWDSELDLLLQDIQTLQARFVQEVYNEHATLLRSYSGNVELKKPNSFRWAVVEPDQTIVVSNGDKIWNYDIELEQVLVQKFNDSKELSPLSLILGDNGPVHDNFTIEKLAVDCFRLYPKESDSSFEYIDLYFKQKVLSKLDLKDNLGQNTLFKFSNLTTNAAIADKTFTLIPPPGVDVIGG